MFTPNAKITQLFRLEQAFLNEKLADIGLSSGLFYFILELAQHDSMSMSELSETVAVDNAYCTRTIQKLVNLGYVVKSPHLGDGRAYCVALTPAGRATCEHVTASLRRWSEIINAGLPAEELEIAQRVIEQWHANAQRYLDELVTG